MTVGGSFSGNMIVKTGHEVQRSELNVLRREVQRARGVCWPYLVISEDENDVGPGVPRVDTEEGGQQHQERS